jgi:hypothetical protein
MTPTKTEQTVAEIHLVDGTVFRATEWKYNAPGFSETAFSPIVATGHFDDGSTIAIEAPLTSVVYIEKADGDE